MLRIIDGQSKLPRLLEEQVFIEEIERLRSQDPTQSALSTSVPITVEALDRLGRLRWRAYCSTLEGLLDLARELGHERSMAGARDRAR